MTILNSINDSKIVTKELLPILGCKRNTSGPNSWTPPKPVFTSNKLIAVTSAFSDGQGEHGVDVAGAEIYNSGLKEICESYNWTCTDLESPLTTELQVPEEQEGDKQWNLNNLRRIGYKLGVLNKGMKEYTEESDGLLVNLGGDHSTASASVSASLDKYPDLRVIWVDAHGDVNTPETSPSGNYHGMPLAHLMGWFQEVLPTFEWMNTTSLKEEHVAFIGLRDIDAGEKDNLIKSGCTYYTMQSLEETNIGTAMDNILNIIDPEGIHPIHISFDVDGADPAVAPGTGTLCEGGLTYSQSLRIVEKVVKTGRLVSMDIVEVNIEKDKKEVPLHGDDPAIDSVYRTVKFALHLLRAAIGYTSI